MFLFTGVWSIKMHYNSKNTSGRPHCLAKQHHMNSKRRLMTSVRINNNNDDDDHDDHDDN